MKYYEIHGYGVRSLVWIVCFDYDYFIFYKQETRFAHVSMYELDMTGLVSHPHVVLFIYLCLDGEGTGSVVQRRHLENN